MKQMTQNNKCSNVNILMGVGVLSVLLMLNTGCGRCETVPVVEPQAEETQADASPLPDNAIDKARASGIPTFVSFGADTCIPCKTMKPFRENIAQKYGDQLNVVYVRVTEDRDLAMRYGVRGIPHIIFFDAEGKEAFTHTGLMQQEQLEEQIQKLGVTL